MNNHRTKFAKALKERLTALFMPSNAAFLAPPEYAKARDKASKSKAVNRMFVSVLDVTDEHYGPLIKAAFEQAKLIESLKKHIKSLEAVVKEKQL